MTTPAILIIFAVLLATLGPFLMNRAPWLEQAPMIGIVAWQALSLSLVSAVLLAGVTLAIPVVPFTTNLAEFVFACTMSLLAQYSTLGGAIAGAAGAVVALAVLGRVGYFLVAGRMHSERSRKQQLDALIVVGRPHRDYDALVVEHPSAAAYCLPGRNRQVVVTSGALAALDHDQVLAVLAHEQAHLRGRHHLILVAADALQLAFPRVPAFLAARSALGRLVEMLADDSAARRSDRLTVATALVRLAEHGLTPVAALGAGGESALGRVRRLLTPSRPLGTAKTILATTAAGMLLALPLIFAVAPASTSIAMAPCEVGGLTALS